MNLEERVIATLKDNLEKRPEIRAESRLAEDLMVDSLEKIMIISALEEEFSLAIADEDLADVVTVNDLIVKIKNRCS
jgi:acyl carrier protein